MGVDGTNTVILPSYFPRNFLLICNNGPGTAGINIAGGTAAMATRGTVQLASGQQIVFQKNVPQNAINAISASTSLLTVYSDDVIPLPSFILQTSPAPQFDLNFVTGQYWKSPLLLTSPPLTFTRASVGTDLLPSSPASSTFTTFASGVMRITPGLGLLIERQRTNNLLNSTVPATQTTGALANGTYTLWVNGSGTATSAAGTAVGAGFGAASQGTPNVFTITNPGTVVVTVAGSLNSFQLELGSYGTSLIVTGAVTATRAADSASLNSSTAWLFSGPAGWIYTDVLLFDVSTTIFIAVDVNNNRLIWTSSSNTQASISNAGTTLTATSGSGGWLTGARAASSWSASGRSICMMGGTVATDANTQPTLSTGVGLLQASGSGNPDSGYYRRISGGGARLSDAMLQAITSPTS